MGAFADGMKMGQNAYQMSLDNERQAAKDAREKILQGREDAKYARDQTQQAEEDNAVQHYGLLTSTGKRNDAGIQANDVDFEKAVAATGQGLPMPVAAPQQPEWTPATDLDRNQGLQGISRARRDWNGVAALQKEEKGLKWDQTFGERLKSYTGADDQIGQAAQYLNTTSKRVSMGDPDKNGVIRMSVVKPDGRADFVKLTRQDQAQLYAAAGMMDMDPVKALTIMSGVNKELAAAYAADNGIEFKLAEAADRSSGRAETKRHNQAVEGNDGARLGLARDSANRKNAQNLREFVDEKGNTVLLDVTGIQPDAQGRMPIPTGLRPKTARAEYTTADVIKLAEGLVGTPMPGTTGGGAPRNYDMNSAMVAARAQLGGSVDQGGGAPAVAPPARNRAAPIPTQSGSHAPTTAPTAKAPDVAAALAEIDARLALKGISEETRWNLMDQRNRLTASTGNTGRFGMTPAPRQYNWIGGTTTGLGSGTDIPALNMGY